MYLVRIIFHPEGDGFKEFYFSREYLSISLSPRSLPAKEGESLGRRLIGSRPLPTLCSRDSLGMRLPFNLSCPCTLFLAIAGFSLSSISPHMIKQVANLFFRWRGGQHLVRGRGKSGWRHFGVRGRRGT